MSFSDLFKKISEIAKSATAIWILATLIFTSVGYTFGKYQSIEEGSEQGRIAYTCITRFKELDFEDKMPDDCIDFYSIYLITKTNKEAIDWGIDIGLADVNKNIEELKKVQYDILDKLDTMSE